MDEIKNNKRHEEMKRMDGKREERGIMLSVVKKCVREREKELGIEKKEKSNESAPEDWCNDLRGSRSGH